MTPVFSQRVATPPCRPEHGVDAAPQLHRRAPAELIADDNARPMLTDGAAMVLARLVRAHIDRTTAGSAGAA